MKERCVKKKKAQMPMYAEVQIMIGMSNIRRVRGMQKFQEQIFRENLTSKKGLQKPDYTMHMMKDCST